jgi:hypothetical protein
MHRPCLSRISASQELYSALAGCLVGFEPALAGGSLPIGYCLAFGEAIASPLARDPLFSGVGSNLSTDITHTAAGSAQTSEFTGRNESAIRLPAGTLAPLQGVHRPV